MFLSNGINMRFYDLGEFVKSVDLDNLMIWYRAEYREKKTFHGGIVRGDRKIAPAAARLYDLTKRFVQDYLWDNGKGDLEVSVRQMEIKKNETLHKIDIKCYIDVYTYVKKEYSNPNYGGPRWNQKYVRFIVDRRNVTLVYPRRFRYSTLTTDDALLPNNLIIGLQKQLEDYFNSLDSCLQDKYKNNFDWLTGTLMPVVPKSG